MQLWCVCVCVCVTFLYDRPTPRVKSVKNQIRSAISVNADTLCRIVSSSFSGLTRIRLWPDRFRFFIELERAPLRVTKTKLAGARTFWVYEEIPIDIWVSAHSWSWVHECTKNKNYNLTKITYDLKQFMDEANTCFSSRHLNSCVDSTTHCPVLKQPLVTFLILLFGGIILFFYIQFKINKSSHICKANSIDNIR